MEGCVLRPARILKCLSILCLIENDFILLPRNKMLEDFDEAASSRSLTSFPLKIIESDWFTR